MKRIVLCADDYGQAPAISQGILSLLQNKRLSATSCMVNTAYWEEHAKQLQAFQGQIDIGLHFNLTEGRPISPEYTAKYEDHFYSLPKLLSLAYLRKIDQLAIEAECEAQLNRFVQVLGFLPHFLDGHQHVHQFPIMRQAVINVYNKHLKGKKAYIRLVKQKIIPQDIILNVKKVIIRVTGTSGLQRLLMQHQIPYNQSFTGIYSFDDANRYKTIFPHFLKEVKDKGLIMCHPALFSLLAGDRIAKARYAEYSYFNSDQFLKDCEANQVGLGRFSD